MSIQPTIPADRSEREGSRPSKCLNSRKAARGTSRRAEATGGGRSAGIEIEQAAARQPILDACDSSVVNGPWAGG